MSNYISFFIYITLIILNLDINASYGNDILNSEILSAINRNYDINVKEYSKIPNGIENKVYRIIDTNNKDYILKVYSTNNWEKIQEEAWLLLSLEKNTKIKVIQILQDKNKNYVGKINNIIFAIFTFIPGQHKNKEDLDYLFLSKVIQNIKNFHFASKKYSIKLKYHKIENQNLVDCFFFKFYRQGIINSIEYLNILDITQNFFRVVMDYKFTTIIHRDLSVHNMIIKDNDIYFIDFDDFIISTPLIEITSFINRSQCLNSKKNIFNIELAKKIIKKFDFNQITNEKFSAENFQCMLIYDLLILIKTHLNDENKTQAEKRKIFNQIYQNILLLQGNKNYIITYLNDI